MSRRQEALCSILGTSEVPVSEDYPEIITLPTAVHDIMVHAVAKTAEDYRERSVRIGYRQGEWLGGIMMRGPSQKGLIARSNIAHNIVSILMPTHLHLHTHPTLSKAQLDDYILPALDRHEARLALNGDELTPEDRERHYTSMATLHGTVDRVPSSNDVRSSLEHPIATVGLAVAASTGAFLSLRRNTDPRTLFRSHPAEDSVQRLSLAHGAYAWLEKHDKGRAVNVNDPASLNNHITYLETSRAQALDPLYVSYASTDIFSPELHKIMVATAQT